MDCMRSPCYDISQYEWSRQPSTPASPTKLANTSFLTCDSYTCITFPALWPGCLGQSTHLLGSLAFLVKLLTVAKRIEQHIQGHSRTGPNLFLLLSLIEYPPSWILKILGGLWDMTYSFCSQFFIFSTRLDPVTELSKTFSDIHRTWTILIKWYYNIWPSVYISL